MNEFDPKCPRGHTTRVGGKARIYATDANGNCPIHGAIEIDGEWWPARWSINGYCGGDFRKSDADIINAPENAPETVEQWVNVYPNGMNIHETLEKAIIGSSTRSGSALPLAGRLKLTFSDNKLTSAEIIKE